VISHSRSRAIFTFALVTCACRTVPKHECSDSVYTAKTPPSNLLATFPHPTYPILTTGTGSLLGFLADSASGMGIPHATVTVMPDSAGQQPHYALTDTAGGFLLSDLTPGLHKFYVRRIAYFGPQFQMTIRANRVDSVTLSSHPVPVEVLCPVTTS
jgi:hypothetical protein